MISQNMHSSKLSEAAHLNSSPAEESFFYSVIIPTFNSEKTLPDTLQSITDQQFGNYEIIIVDGLSNDGTVKIVREFAGRNQYVRWISEKDFGIYDAMNKGIALAKGQWLYFLGSDDKLYNKTVLQEIATLASDKQTNVIYGNVKVVGDTSWIKDGAVYDGLFDAKKLIRKNICHQAMFYRREFITKEIGFFNTKYTLCADWDFNLRCYSRTVFLYTEKIIAFFSAGGESTKSNTDEHFSRDFVKNILTCFAISPFDPLVNDSSFSFFQEVLARQKKSNYLKYLKGKFSRKFFS